MPACMDSLGFWVCSGVPITNKRVFLTENRYRGAWEAGIKLCYETRYVTCGGDFVSEPNKQFRQVL